MTALGDSLRSKFRFVLAYAQITFRNSLAYKADLFIKLAGYPARLVMVYFLWRVLLEANMVRGHDFEEILTYYVISFFLTQMYPFARMARDIRTEIFSGDVVTFMARGVPHWAVWIGRFLATSGSYLILVTPVVAVLILTVGSLDLTLLGFVSFLAMLLLGIVIKGQLWYLVGISSYFTEENMGTIRLYTLVEQLLSGALVPLFLFPDWVGQIQKYLPFAYTLYAPVRALQQPPTGMELAVSAGAGMAWALLLSVVISVTAHLGWRRFTAHGA